MANSLPNEVRRFILEHIGSLEMLNVLLMLFAQPERAWSDDEVGRDGRTNAFSANLQLEALTVHGLVEMVPGSPLRYRAQPRFADIVAATRRTFAERRVAIITLIYSRPDEPDEPDGTDADPVQAFADAFKLRKDK